MDHATPNTAGLLLAQEAANATTAIVVGNFASGANIHFGRYNHLLWFVDAASSERTPSGISPGNVEVVLVEKLSAVETLALLERFVRRNPRRLPSVYVTASILQHQHAGYDQVIDEVHRHLESTHRARTTRQKDGFAWQKHLLSNARHYVDSRMPESWAGRLRGLPAFVCGSGPSLDVSISRLTANADRAVVFSADSALAALARHGVAADFAVSIDPAKVPEKCVTPQLPPTFVVTASVSPPSWHRTVQGSRLYCLSSNQITDDWFAAHGVPRTSLGVVESCGSTALELAHFLGCDPIYLFGLDLAVDPSNQTRRHQQAADPSLYVNSNYDPATRLPRVPGNYVDVVPCFALDDWRELDARLANRSDTQLFNINDRGARLRGTTLVHPDQFAIPPMATPKRERLESLDEATPDPAAPAALAALNAVGQRCHQAVPGLRRALANKGPAVLAEGFRLVLRDQECARVLGAFSLKLMPHLVPPIEGEPAFWRSLLDEFEELAALAHQAGCSGSGLS